MFRTMCGWCRNLGSKVHRGKVWFGSVVVLPGVWQAAGKDAQMQRATLSNQVRSKYIHLHSYPLSMSGSISSNPWHFNEKVAAFLFPLFSPLFIYLECSQQKFNADGEWVNGASAWRARMFPASGRGRWNVSARRTKRGPTIRSKRIRHAARRNPGRRSCAMRRIPVKNVRIPKLIKISHRKWWGRFGYSHGMPR